MRTIISFLLAVVLPLLVASQCISAANNNNAFVMPWFCTERCGRTNNGPKWTPTDVQRHVDLVLAHRNLISRVAFERYNLGPNGTLVVNTDLSDLAPVMKKNGFTTIAMISSFPYPKDFIDWMRYLWSSSERTTAFAQLVVDHLNEDGIDGVNVDFEPAQGVDAADAKQYALFLYRFSIIMIRNNKFFSIDVAAWGNLWNFTELSNALLPFSDFPGGLAPQLTTMSTYTWNNTEWLKQLNYAQAHIDKRLLTVGLQTFEQTDVDLRFETLAQRGLCRVGIWDVSSMLNNTWWSAIRTFLENCKN